ncbi:MAG: carbohydrate ABC transporter permease [Nitrososphaerota archaeon]
MLFPVYWIIISSLKTTDEIYSGNPSLLPTNPTITHYIKLFNPGEYFGGGTGPVMLNSIKNSIIVSVGTMIISIILSTMAGYALSRLIIKGKELLARMLLIVYMFPSIILVVPIFQVMSLLKLIDNHFALIMVYVTFSSPFISWLFRTFFDAIPKEIEESAMIDGASRFRTFIHVLLPIVGPGLLTGAIFSFITAWGEYTFTTILINTEAKKTVGPALDRLIGGIYIDWGGLLAGTVLIILPVIIFFLPLAKRFLQGFMMGAIKG